MMRRRDKLAAPGRLNLRSNIQPFICGVVPAK